MTGSINIWYPHTHNVGDIFSEMIAFEWIILRRVLYSTNSPLYNTHWSHVDKRMKECDSMEYFPELISVFRSLSMRGTVGWGGNLVSRQPHGSGFASDPPFLICSINNSNSCLITYKESDKRKYYFLPYFSMLIFYFDSVIKEQKM